MSTALARRALEIFEASLELPEAERTRWVAAACVDVPGLIEAVNRLLAASGTDAGFGTGGPGMCGPFQPPDSIGPYRLTRRLGAGGMGEVWRAERSDGMFDRAVAIKFLVAAGGSVARTLFDAERRILATLDHPAIARLLDGGTLPDGTAYFVMELVDGIALDQAAQGCTLDSIVGLLAEVGEALACAHAGGVVHADIKPSNVLVASQGGVKLLDFGVARLTAAVLAQEAGLDRRPLTAAYASPERLRGSPPAKTCDVFALGVVAFELLTGVRRREAAPLPLSPLLALGARRGGRIAAIDRDLDAVLRRATHPDPALRYPDARALLADLRAWLARRPVSARPLGGMGQVHRWALRHPRTATAAMLGATCLAGALATATVISGVAERERLRAEARFGEVQALARYQIFEVYEALARQPGTTETRYLMAREAQAYLDRLNAEAGSHAVAMDAARGLLRLAEIMGVPGSPNLGDPATARANLDRVEQLLGDRVDHEASLVRARAKTHRAAIALWSDLDSPLAAERLAEAEAILADLPDSEEKHEVLLMVAVRDVERLDWNETYAEVLDRVERARGLLATWPETDRSVRARALFEAKLTNRAGDALWYLGQREAAVAHYRDAEQLILGGLALAPNDAELLYASLQTGYSLGSALQELGELEPALAILVERTAVGERLMQIEAHDVGLHRRVWVMLGGLAQAQLAADALDAALATQARALGLAEAAAARRPLDRAAQRDVAWSLMASGSVHARRGEEREACSAWQQARDGFLALQQAGGLHVFDVTHHLGFLDVSVARCTDPAANDEPAFQQSASSLSAAIRVSSCGSTISVW